MSFPVDAVSIGVSQNGSQVEEKKDGYVYYEVKPGFTIRLRQNIDPAMEPKKLKRIISNRVSAQKSRWKKLQYVEALEKRSMELQRQQSILHCQLETVTVQKRYLENEQKQLNERISALLQHCIDSKSTIGWYKSEIERMKKMKALPINLT